MVTTSLTRNQVVRKGTWVRIPPSPPQNPWKPIVSKGFFFGQNEFLMGSETQMVPVVPCFVVPKSRAVFIGNEYRGAQMVPGKAHEGIRIFTMR